MTATSFTSEPSGIAYEAIAELYHAFLTGVILTTVTRRGEAAAADLVFGLFRRQHRARFLPGLEKLGLRRLPDAVACAQYHYLSNQLAGVRVEYMYESDRKAWVRYVPPRWIYDGTAICAVPSSVSRAVLRGWHAHNGVTLGNPRLGFVCTGQTTDGQPGLEGYYYVYDHELTSEERLRFEPGEEGPEFDPDAAPRLEAADWPIERLRKAARNYTMDYVHGVLVELVERFGPADGGFLGHITGKLIGMQLHRHVASLLPPVGSDAAGFAELFVALARAQGDEVDIERSGDDVIVRQRTWRLLRDQRMPSPAIFDAWNGLWEGLLSVHNRRLCLGVTARLDHGDGIFEWLIGQRRR